MGPDLSGLVDPVRSWGLSLQRLLKGFKWDYDRISLAFYTGVYLLCGEWTPRVKGKAVWTLQLGVE